MAEDSDKDFIERRDNTRVLEAIGDLKNEMTDRLARIETKQEALGPRCDSHSEDITALNARTTSLESSREYAKGVIKTVSVGAPAVGTIGYAIAKLIKFMQHGGG